MSTVSLIDYEDIYTAICEEVKIQLTDGSTVARIKRDVNMIYLNHVVPFKPRAWWWLEYNQDLQTYAKITTGTITIVDGSTTVTFSSAPTGSVAGYYLKVEGFQEVIEVLTHTALATTAVLRSAWRRGNVTAGGYKLWKDYASLDSDLKEVIQVTHDKMPIPLDMKDSPKFQEIRARLPDYETYPKIATVGDYDADDNRILKWYPACDSTQHTMHVKGVQHVTKLTADADEPLMPVEDRIVLFYGAVSRAWARERNESEAGKNWQLFQQKLIEMAGKAQAAPKTTEMSVDSDWLVNKRYKRMSRGRRSSNWSQD